MKELDKYILEHIDEEDPVLMELDRETHLKVLGARMLSGNLQGQLLTMLSKIIQPERILEVGTFTGYSAICLAKGLAENGKLITIEADDELEFLAKKYFEKAGLADKIELRIGPALEIIPEINETFDLVFLDADKREYTDYFYLIFDKLKSGGIILADNTLWNGKVLKSPAADDHQTKGIVAFNKLIKNEKRIEKIILPLRDGMTVIRKK